MRRLLGLGLALVALLALVSLASRGPRPLGFGGGTEHVGPEFFDYAFTAFVIAFVAGLAAAVVAVGRMRREFQPRPQRAWWRSVVTLAAVLLMLALLARVHGLPHLPGNPGAGAAGGDRSRTLPRDRSVPGARDIRFKWLEAAVAGGVALAALAALALVRRRHPSDGPAEPGDDLAPAAEEVSLLLDYALHDLRAERDLRRAVIAAYARMERTLADHGLPRRRSEAPLEYLERALGRLRASSRAGRRLTDLFEWAKFSDHEVDAAMRDEAVAALTQVRDELRAAAA